MSSTADNGDTAVPVVPVSQSERNQRCDNAAELMRSLSIDSLFLAGGPNLKYFSGLRSGYSDRISGCLITADGRKTFLCPKFEYYRMKEVYPPDARVVLWEENENPFLTLHKSVQNESAKFNRFALDCDAPFWVLDLAKASFPDADIVNSLPVTMGCRMIKSPLEIARMQKANACTLTAVNQVLGQVYKGMTTGQFNTMLKKVYSDMGVTGSGLIVFGTATASPHGLPSPQSLARGDVIIADSGCMVEEYVSDISRTVVFGQPSPLQQKIWQTLRDAQLAVLDAAQPGVPCQDLDRVARRIVEQAGFGDGYSVFMHRLGHGIGTGGHEWPFLVDGNPLPLQSGMCFSNEPGIYLPDKFGIRLEDCFTITDSGSHSFTGLSSGL
jgi:Xaa-Pro dipeptidase